MLRDIYKDLITRLMELSSEENIVMSQPCRDNTLYLLRLIDEMLMSEMDQSLPVCNVAGIHKILINFVVSHLFVDSSSPPRLRVPYSPLVKSSFILMVFIFPQKKK